MSWQMISPERFLLSDLAAQVQWLRELRTVSYSLRLEVGLAELVRLKMRQLAQAQAMGEGILLATAIDQTTARLDECLMLNKLDFDCTPYWPGLQSQLRFAAKEMSGLSQQLVRSRQARRVATREQLLTTTIPLELVTIGLPQAIEALLIIPQAAELILNLAEVQREYACQGEWFPYEISLSELSCVLDDDGTLLLLTQGLSNESLGRSRAQLLQLAEQLYRPLE